jgi:hypothetical protein
MTSGNSDSTATRRDYLRRGVELGSVGCAISTAGCLDLLGGSSVGAGTSGISEQAGTELSADEFETYVGDMRDRYGDGGPWGSGGADLDDGLSYRGAWTQQVHITEDGNPYQGDPDNLLVTSDNVAALYEISGMVDRNGKQHFAVLLWSAARIPDEKRGGGPIEGTPVVGRIQPGIELKKFTEEMLVYFPSKRHSGDDVPVVLPPPVSFDSSYPLHQGKIEPATKSRVGEEGIYAVEWTGEYDRQQSVIGVAEVRWDPKETYNFTWTVKLGGGRSRLL